MAIAALIAWLVTAVLGFTMLGIWIARGALRPAAGDTGAAPTRLAPPLVFSHFLLAAGGLVVWIVYLVAGAKILVWVALGLLVLIAVLGDVMFLRWWRSRRDATPEARLPTPVVYMHDVFAVTTVVLVLLTGLGVGAS